jgi:hypothetical protein
MNPHTPHLKAIRKLLEGVARRHDRHTVFADAIESMALAFSNAVDHARRETREGRYREIAKRYSREELDAFSQVMGELTLAMEAKTGDVLGALFTEMELTNKYAGQFFTPYELCALMARMQIGDGIHPRRLIAEKGYISAHEPACGAGAMVIALADALRDSGINYQQHLHVSAIDVDRRAAHMAYVQFSLLHIPALVIVGNALTLEEREHWFTPAHVLGGWSARLRRADAEARARELLLAAAAPAKAEPVAIPAPPAIGKAAQLSLF